MAQGWISIHRKIQECDIWLDDEPFDRRSAWIDLLLLANHEDKSIIFDGHRITVKRGQYLSSVRKLSAKWHWGKNKTLAFLRLLEECEMITREADSRRTLITIAKYDIYQNEDIEQRTVKGQSRDSKGTVTGHRQATNNNDNNENNENNENKKEKENIKEKEPRHKYGEYQNILLTDEQLEKLKQEFPDDWQKRIDNCSAYCKSTGKTYKDYLATIRNWARKEHNQNNQKGGWDSVKV